MEPLPGWGSSPWSLTTTANTFRVVLCVFLLNFLRCISVQPLCREEEYAVGDECCPMCNPGYHVKHACSARTGTVCAPCPPQTYTAHANGLSECLSCGVCDPDMDLLTWRECSSREDTVCRCSPGYFCETQEGEHCSTCLPYSACPPGQRVLKRGNYSHDTVCADCLTGTFSPGGTQEECLPWTKCNAWFQKEAQHGTSSTDVTCSSWLLYFFIFLSLPIIAPIVYIYIRRKPTHGSEQHPSRQGSGPQEGSQGSLQVLQPAGPWFREGQSTLPATLLAVRKHTHVCSPWVFPVLVASSLGSEDRWPGSWNFCRGRNKRTLSSFQSLRLGLL